MSLPFPVVIPFAASLGLRLCESGGGRAEIALQSRPDLCNSFGSIHGGVTMTLLDVVMVHAAASPETEGSTSEERSAITVEMKTSFLRPGTGSLIAKGRVLHRTASMAFCEGSVQDAEGSLVAHATGTFKVVKRAAAEERKV